LRNEAANGRSLAQGGDRRLVMSLGTDVSEHNGSPRIVRTHCRRQLAVRAVRTCSLSQFDEQQQYALHF
jgi:hypothetical protein